MRIVVYGVGAIGGMVASALHRSGAEVIGIARGAQLDAIRTNGLHLRSVDLDFVARFQCVAGPEDIGLRPDDMILLTMKSQDTAEALQRLVACGLTDQPVFCVQNGVANERLAASMGMNVHGVTVLSPTTFVTPGVVAVHATPKLGIFDIGRYPDGSDHSDHALADVMSAAGVACFVTDTVMENKYGKLLMNLGNVVQAAVGYHVATNALSARVRQEAAQVLEAAGIRWVDVNTGDPRRDELLRMDEIKGVARSGSSTVQSLLRNTGTIETDYLNGEIASLGATHGIATPLNSGLAKLGQVMAHKRMAPGAFTLAELENLLQG